MRVVFMGTPDFSVPTLKELAGIHEVAAVVTQPDKPKGRGKTMQHTAVKEAALELNITVYQPVKVREPEFIQILKELKPDIIVVVAFGQILPKEILELPRFGCVNVHASLLPKYRGAAPIQWAVIDGEKVSGVTTMKMAEGLDTGDMILKKEIVLDKNETGGSLHDKLSAEGAVLCARTLEVIENGTAVYEEQDDDLSSYAKMLDKKLGKIDWKKKAASLECLIRGLNPWPSAYTSYNGKILKVWKAHVKDGRPDAIPGQVIEAGKDFIEVQTGEGSLVLDQVQLQGKKRMDTGDFLRGCPVQAGEKFE